eukprot:scaffold48_cov395-Prasinococcus_capsulatus_cf.AAC.4
MPAGVLSPFVSSGESIGKEVKAATDILKKAFEAEKPVIEAFVSCKKPAAPTELQALVQPIADQIKASDELLKGAAELLSWTLLASLRSRRGDAFNHQKAISECVRALSWVVYTGPESGMSLPSPHVSEAWQSAEFYTNKILREFKGVDDRHVTWVKALKELCAQLQAYVKKHHATGPAWNPKGIDLKEYLAGGGGAPSSSKPMPPAGGPPPPPPPMPAGGPGALIKEGGNAAPSGGGMNALLADLNKGSGATAGLRKVTDDMKAKNRTDRTGAVKASDVKSTSSSATTSVATKTMPPKLELQQGRKWIIEHQVGNRDIVIEDTKPVMTLYAYACKNCVIQVRWPIQSMNGRRSVAPWAVRVR